VPAGKMVHVILDNYAAHKHPKVRAWLDLRIRPRAKPVGAVRPVRRRPVRRTSGKPSVRDATS
jgi:hypothetical protein